MSVDGWESLTRGMLRMRVAKDPGTVAEHLRRVGNDAGQSGCIFEDLPQGVLCRKPGGRNCATREAPRCMFRVLQQTGYASPSVVMPPDDFVPPAAIMPRHDNPLWSTLVQPQVQRTEGRRLGNYRAQLNANAPLRDRKADEAEVQYREFAQFPIFNRRAQSRPKHKGV